jgi:hypothetical protein
VWGDGQAIVQDARGNLLDLQRASWGTETVPIQEVAVLTLLDVCLRGTDGTYVVTYDGDGFLDFGMVRKRGARADSALPTAC